MSHVTVYTRVDCHLCEVALQQVEDLQMLVDKASMLTLSVPEMTVLVGGMRALNANAGQAPHGVRGCEPNHR